MKKILALFGVIVCSAAIFACNKNKGTNAPAESGATTPQATTVTQATQGAELPKDTENEKYDKNGNLIYKKHTLDSGKTGKEEFFTYSAENALLSHEVLEYEYDSQGNLVSRVSSDILNGAKSIIFEQKYTYDAKNRVTEEEFRILGNSGALFLYNKITLSYDGEGTLTHKASLFYGENTSLSEGHFWEYDGNGKQTSFRKETYFCRADGSAEEIRGESIDEKGNVKFTYTALIEYGEFGKTAETSRKYGKDGALLSKKTAQFEYNESGNTAKVTEKEFIGESLLARVTVTATEYGESGKTVTKEETVYDGESMASSVLYVSKYDKNGKVSEFCKTENGRELRTLYTYSENGLCTREQTYDITGGKETFLSYCENFYGSEGEIRARSEYVYSQSGEPSLSAQWEFYKNGNPKIYKEINSGSITLYREFDMSGEMVYEEIY